MKKFFMFAAMASVALASCTKNEPAASVEQGELITFDAPVVAPVTKAGNAEFLGDSFKVYSYYSEEDEYDGTGTIYINGAVVNKNLGDGKWKVDGKEYYWPKNGKLSFVAYSPVSVDASSDADALTIEYTVPSEANEDLLVSAWNNDLTYGTAGEVPLAFNHVLSSVNFTFAAMTESSAADVVGITKIELQEVNTSATYTMQYSSVGEWGISSSPANYTLYSGNKVLLKSLALTKNDLLLLPQTLSDDVILHVEYTLPADAADGTETTLAQEADIQLNTAIANSSALATWAQGTKYNYTITFDVQTMTFVPTVVEDANWVDGVNVSAEKVL